MEALAIIDIHAHCVRTEVIGLLGGRYCPQTRELRILTSEPCASLDDHDLQCDMEPGQLLSSLTSADLCSPLSVSGGREGSVGTKALSSRRSVNECRNTVLTMLSRRLVSLAPHVRSQPVAQRPRDSAQLPTTLLSRATALRRSHSLALLLERVGSEPPRGQPSGLAVQVLVALRARDQRISDSVRINAQNHKNRQIGVSRDLQVDRLVS